MGHYTNFKSLVIQVKEGIFNEDMEKVNVTNKVVEYIRENIRSGYWTVGNKIPSENQLTEILGVSRVSVRAAIRHFVGLGILESVHGSGTFLLTDQLDPAVDTSMHLTPEDCKDLKKVLEFREIIEKDACYMAVINASDELIQRLRAALEKMIENVGNQKAFVQADVDFHMAICEASENPLIIKCMNMVYSENWYDFIHANEQFGYKDGIYYHSLILSAFESGNADFAREYMQEHLSQAAERLNIG